MCCTETIIKVVGLCLSITLLIMNGVYTIWGLFLPKGTESEDREELKRRMETLELYKDVVSYSDAIMVPANAIFWVLSHFWCKSLKKMNDDDSHDGFDVERSRRSIPGVSGGTLKRAGTIATFQTS